MDCRKHQDRAKTLLIILFILLSPIAILAETFYVDATNGDDANAGTSEIAPWKTIAKVNSMIFDPADMILFKRGEIWREELVIKNSGVSGSPIIFSSYGAGERPIITAADLVGDWTKTPGYQNVWQTTAETETRIVIFNQTLGKENNSVDELDNEFDWYWQSGILFIYSAFEPAQTYIHPGIEVGKRNNAIAGHLSSHYTIDGLELRGANGKMNHGAGLLVIGDYVTIQNCSFMHNFYAGIHAADAADHGTISNCEIHHNQDNGIALGRGSGWAISDCSVYSNGYGPRVRSGILFDTSNSTVSRCVVYDNGNGSAELGLTHGIYVNPFANNVVIEDCIIYDHRNGNGINYDANSGAIRRNYIFNNYFSGIHLENQQQGGLINIHNNVVHGNNCGIMLYEWEWNPATKINIFNNTVFENNRYLLVPGKVDQQPAQLYILANVRQLQIYNNIFFTSSKYPALFAISQSNMISDNNCIYKPTGPTDKSFCFYAGRTRSFRAWQTATGGDRNSITAHPLFVPSSKNEARDFQLDCNSPCKGAGNALVGAVVTTDFAGNPFDGLDIGAFKVTCGNDIERPQPPTGVRAIIKQ
jgi:parallel beta-helix repeat protein